MIGNSIMLMFVGMGTVFVFLVLLNAAISLLEFFTRDHARREESALAEAELARKKKKKKSIEKTESGIPTAAISAAVHAYRNA